MRQRRRSYFGDTELPEELQTALRRATRLEWLTLAFVLSAVVLVYLVMGGSQAMKAAWLEDMLSLIPPIAFLVGARLAQVRPDRDFPFGLHRSVAVGHLIAGTALVAMGLFLLYDSGSALLKAEHPSIGTLHLLGHTIWAGWPMVAVMTYTLVVPVILGRLKLPVAEQLHDKVLYADADMNKADWMTAGGAIVGVLGIGVGLWWLDAVMALLISASILRDGSGNVTSAVAGLMDKTAQTVDMKDDHPLVQQVGDYLDSRPWIDRHDTRIRDMGHVFHVEVRFVPVGGRVDLARIHQTVEDLRAMDWKLDDITVAPVRSLREGETQTAR